MKKKKVLVTASTFPRWQGDSEPRFVLDLCKAMQEYCEITVLVPACPNAKEEEILEGVRVIRYHYFPIHRFETLCYPGAIVPRIKERKVRALLVPFLFLGLWIALKRNIDNYDYVHAHWIIPQGIIQSFFRKPFIVTGHGGDVCSLNKGLVRILKKRCIKRAKHVTVVSEHLKDRILELVPDKNIDVIPMGVDTSTFGPQFHIDNYFGQENRKCVLFVGRLAEIKGVKYLIEAMQYLDANLYIVGDGPDRTNLESLAYDMSLKRNWYKNPISYCPGGMKCYGNVFFMGSKSHDELKNIYASADLFCMPSITTLNGEKEGFGLVMLEAMASGIPVVASNSGGISQLINDGINGLLVEEKSVFQLVDSISSLLDDLELYKKIRDGGFATVQSSSYASRAAIFAKYISNSCELG